MIKLMIVMKMAVFLFLLCSHSLSQGQCGGPGTLVICTQEYDPVCGCDGNTYANACIAGNAGILSYIQGACGSSSCTGSVTGSQTCLAIYDPVCGCDGVTYSNDCYAFNAGVLSTVSGECQTSSAALELKQSSSDDNGLVLINDADGNDIWSIRVGVNDLGFWYDSNGSSGGVNTTIKAEIDDADGSWDQRSDRVLKTDITNMQSGILEKVLRLEPKTYYYKSDRKKSRKSIGFIAQEVQAIFPEIINDDNEHLALSYSDFGVLAIAAIKEQNEKIIELEKQILDLKNVVRRIYLK